MSTPTLLRPPVEWYTTAACGWAIGWLLGYPQWFALSPLSQMILMLGFAVLGVWRFCQGLPLVRYRRRLMRLPTYPMAAQNIPVSHEHLFLGKGFQWQPTHTQRLRDLDTPAHAHLKTTVKDSGDPALHAVGVRERHITMPLDERSGHLLVLGTTGVGKTRFAELLISQDIRRHEVVIVIDPKGDSELLQRVVSEAKRAGRIQDVRLFHLGFPKTSARYNPIGQFTRSTEVANRIANQLPGGGDSAAFREFGWKFTNLVTQALIAMGIKPTYRWLNRYLHHIDELLIDYLTFVEPAKRLQTFIQQAKQDEPPACDLPEEPSKDTRPMCREYIQYCHTHQLHQTNPIIAGLLKACQYDRSYYDKITASLSPLLDKLTTGHVAELLTPAYENAEDPRPIIDWLQVIRHRQIVYVGLDALTDTTVASSVGNAMLSDLVSMAGQLYNHGITMGLPNATSSMALPTIQLHVDEANEVMGNEFIPMLNKARGAGFRITAYTQTVSDIQARLQDMAKTGQVLGNLGAIVSFRVKEARTAQLITEQLPTVAYQTLTHHSSVSDHTNHAQGDNFTSQNEDRLTTQDIPMLANHDLMNLPKGHAFALLAGGKLYKLRMPRLQEQASKNSPEALMRQTQIEPQTSIASPHPTQWATLLRNISGCPSALFDAYYAPTLSYLLAHDKALEPTQWRALFTYRQGQLLPIGAGSETIAHLEPLWTYAVWVGYLIVRTRPPQLEKLTDDLPEQARQWLQSDGTVWQELSALVHKRPKDAPNVWAVLKNIWQHSPTGKTETTSSKTTIATPQLTQWRSWVKRKLDGGQVSYQLNTGHYCFADIPRFGKDSVFISEEMIDHYCQLKQMNKEALIQALHATEQIAPTVYRTTKDTRDYRLWRLEGLSLPCEPDVILDIQPENPT